jgi:flavin-dependent dehydrogenase
MSARPDLLVIGGGPAGAALSALAAEAGARTLLVERRRFPRDKVCGEFLSAEGCRVLRRLGVLDELVASGGQWMDRCRLSNRRGACLDVPLPQLADGGREALGISRERMDTALLELAARRGVEVRQASEALEPVGEAGALEGVRVRRVGTRGSGERLAASLVVAADGRRSLLARLLHPHLGDPERTRAGSRFGLKVHLEGNPSGLGGRVELHLFAGGYAGLAGIEDGRINLCLLVTAGALRACGGSPQRLLDERIRANPAARERLEGCRPASPWRSVGPLRFGPRRAAASGVLFVGDAAGTIDPFCGEGMSNALAAAELARPFVLEAIARGGLGDELARSYQRAWTRSFARVTRSVRGLGWLLEHPRLADAGLGLLSRRAPGLARRLVLATRTGRGLRPATSRV